MSKERKLRTLYRPVGLGEMVEIAEAESTRFPPRRPEQPIFYPVLTREYAEQIAERWNAPAAESGHVGFVTAFDLDTHYAAQFTAHVVGSAEHRELWVPADQLEDLNHHLVGPITLVSAYYGTGYGGPTPRPAMLKGSSAHEQLPLLERILDYSGMDFILEVRVQRVVVQLNFAYWVRTDFTADGLPPPQQIRLLKAVQDVWTDAFPQLTPLLGSDELQVLAGELRE